MGSGCRIIVAQMLLGCLLSGIQLVGLGQTNQAQIQWIKGFSGKGAISCGGRNGDTLYAVQNAAGGAATVGKYSIPDQQFSEQVLPGSTDNRLVILPAADGIFSITYQQQGKNFTIHPVKYHWATCGVAEQGDQLVIGGDRHSRLFFQVSKNQRAVMVYSSTYLRKENQIVLDVSVVSTSTCQLLNRFSFRYPFNLTTLESSFVGDDGLLVLVTRTMTEKWTVLSRGTWTTALHVFSGNQQVLEKDFRIEGYETASPDIVADSAGAMFAGAYLYPTGGKASELKGRKFFFGKVNPSDFSITASILVPVDSLYRQAKLGLKEDIPFSLREVITTPRGEHMAIAEQVKLLISDVGMSSITNDLMCMRVNPSFTAQQTTRIPKRQTGIAITDYLATMKGEDLYVLYNDHKANQDPDPEHLEELAVRKSKNGLFLIRVQPDGHFSKTLLADYQDDTIAPPDFFSSKVCSAGELLLATKNGFAWLRLPAIP